MASGAKPFKIKGQWSARLTFLNFLPLYEGGARWRDGDNDALSAIHTALAQAELLLRTHLVDTGYVAEVYNLRDLAQFPGTYGQARYGFAIGTASVGRGRSLSTGPTRRPPSAFSSASKAWTSWISAVSKPSVHQP
jgi:hypothetical protein